MIDQAYKTDILIKNNISKDVSVSAEYLAFGWDVNSDFISSGLYGSMILIYSARCSDKNQTMHTKHHGLLSSILSYFRYYISWLARCEYCTSLNVHLWISRAMSRNSGRGRTLPRAGAGPRAPRSRASGSSARSRPPAQIWTHRSEEDLTLLWRLSIMIYAASVPISCLLASCV